MTIRRRICAIRWTALASAAVVAASCSGSGPHVRARTTSTTYIRGAIDSPYWVAGWIPHNVHGKHASDPRSDERRKWSITYHDGSESRPIFSITTTTGARPTQRCAIDTSKLGLKVRGHEACESPNHDDGSQFGSIVTWNERDDLHIEVSVYTPALPSDARSIALHIAESLRPITATAARTLVAMSQLLDPTDPAASRFEAASGRIGLDIWTVTAIIPVGYPLTPDDHRLPCTELKFRGERQHACASDGGSGSGLVEISGHVFAYGAVREHIEEVALEEAYRAPNFSTARLRGVVATAKTFAVGNAAWRYYAAELPRDNCGVQVLDASIAPRQMVGSALTWAGRPGPCFDRRRE